MERIIKESFTIIGKEGSTQAGEGFIQRLWEDANSHFGEIAHLAKMENGQLCGVWGAMSDFSRSFAPWENSFTQGLYLAGAECIDSAEPPAGWAKWIIPGYEYLRVESTPEAFPATLNYIAQNSLTLAGAVHDFTDPATGRNYMLFPIRRL
ncbi:MAG: GyrI-like domain-containing protein [Clostridiales bacterium]|nr:GyrI-like domain-containing protein [Clostridiales bacterium]